jgi:RNA polymerase sigma-70 factor (sigma-E family)
MSSQPANRPQGVPGDGARPRGDESRNDLLVRLFNEHYKSLVRLASQLLDDIPTCEEVVQDAFVKMQTAKRTPEPGKEAAYLRSIVMNGARSHMRKRMVRRRHRPEAPLAAPSAEHGVMGSVERDRILEAVRTLPRRQAEVLVLRYFSELSEAEIAETLDISLGSVKTHSSRGIAALDKILGGER